MAGPASVIVAGLVSAYLAVITSDGISPEYRLGLAIGQTLGRVCSTAAVGYSSAVRIDDRGGLRITLAGGNAPPYRLQMRLTHPTRAGVEKVIGLETMGKGSYEAVSGKLPAGRWQVMLEDPARIWQLGGEWELVAGQPVVLGAAGRL